MKRLWMACFLAGLVGVCGCGSGGGSSAGVNQNQAGVPNPAARFGPASQFAGNWSGTWKLTSTEDFKANGAGGSAMASGDQNYLLTGQITENPVVVSTWLPQNSFRVNLIEPQDSRGPRMYIQNQGGFYTSTAKIDSRGHLILIASDAGSQDVYGNPTATTITFDLVKSTG
jgi:hypothetical protein